MLAGAAVALAALAGPLVAAEYSHDDVLVSGQEIFTFTDNGTPVTVVMGEFQLTHGDRTVQRAGRGDLDRDPPERAGTPARHHGVRGGRRAGGRAGRHDERCHAGGDAPHRWADPHGPRGRVPGPERIPPV